MTPFAWALGALCALLAMVVAVLAARLSRAHRQAKALAATLAEVAAGNGNRRLLARPGDVLAPAVFAANEVVVRYEHRLAELARREAAGQRVLTSLSHDVRTPLTSLMGYLDALERRFAGELGTDASAYVATAAAKARDLKRYTDELFEYCRLEAGEFPLAVVELDVAEEVRRILADWIVRFEEAGVELAADIPDGPCCALADARALERIVSNLLGNALEHARARHVTVSLRRAGAGLITIQVADDGVGIAPHDCAHIFDRLYTVDASRRSGSGLGLSIARELARAGGGDITVASCVGKGTTFRIVLPHLPGTLRG